MKAATMKMTTRVVFLLMARSAAAADRILSRLNRGREGRRSARAMHACITVTKS